MATITINNKTYKVQEAKTKEEREKGLSNKRELPENEGMLFYFNIPTTVSMWMKDTYIPLDIIFIDENLEVIKVVEGIPLDESSIICKNTLYVLEVNQDSGIQVGDELEFDDEDDPPVMKILAPDGSELYELWGGERIISRRETKILISKAKKADESNEDKDYKALGKYIFKVFNGQDNRDPEYVTVK